MHRHPIFCILPPDMLKNISEKGSAQQREMAQNTLKVSEKFRTQRQALTGIQSFNAAAGPVQTSIQRTIYSAKFGTKLPGKIVRKEGSPPSTEPASAPPAAG